MSTLKAGQKAIFDKKEMVTIRSVGVNAAHIRDSEQEDIWVSHEELTECYTVTILQSGKAREQGAPEPMITDFQTENEFASCSNANGFNAAYAAWRESDSRLKELPYKLPNNRNPSSIPLEFKILTWYAFINEEQVFVLVKPVEK